MGEITFPELENLKIPIIKQTILIAQLIPAIPILNELIF